MLLELHAHTKKYSKCSQIEPVELIRRVMSKKIQGIVITEHHYLWAEEEIRQLRIDAQAEDSFLLMSAEEVDTDKGHILVFGAGRMIGEPVSLENIKARFPKAGLVWAHPWRKGSLPSERQLLSPDLDAVEIFSSNHEIRENALALSLWHKFKFTALCGSDTHTAETAAIFPTQFDHPVADINELAIEIKTGRCRPFFKEIPKSGSNLRVTEVVIGTKGEDETRDRLILRNLNDQRKWAKALASVKIIGKLYNSGFNAGKFRVPKIINVDAENLNIIEEGQRGKTIFELIQNVSPRAGLSYFRLAGQWLARLHNLRLKVDNPDDVVRKEKQRFHSYREAFSVIDTPQANILKDLVALVENEEEMLFKEGFSSFTQNHGDFHPKNIIIGQDKAQDVSTLFISVIDFANSILMAPSFDVGYFLAQFRNQFFAFADIRRRFKEEYFLKAYLQESKSISRNFLREVLVFQIRANLSISAYLIKVGKGISPEIDSICGYSLSLKRKLKQHNNR